MSAASSAPAGGGGFPWTWAWIALGIAAAIGLVAWAAAARHRRAGTAAEWQVQRVGAYATGSALHDAMAAAETPGAFGADDAALRWSDIQRRADDFGQMMHGMEQTAPSDQDRIVVANVLASLYAARSAMDAERSAGADGSLSRIAHARLSYFAISLDAMRQPIVRPA